MSDPSVKCWRYPIQVQKNSYCEDCSYGTRGKKTCDRFHTMRELQGVPGEGQMHSIPTSSKVRMAVEKPECMGNYYEEGCYHTCSCNYKDACKKIAQDKA